MVGITEASAAVSGLKAAYDLAKGVQALTADAGVKMATIDLMETILSAQQSAVEALGAQQSLQKRIAELEEKLASANDWREERSRYELVEYPTGSMVYSLRSESANGEIPHRLCPTCFQRGAKSILQVYAKHSGGEMVTCLPCDTKITLSNFRSPEPYDDRGSDYY